MRISRTKAGHEPRHKEQKMTTSETPSTPQGHFPKCPTREHLAAITEFFTPGSDFPPPHPIDASISLNVFDPTEFVAPGQLERIRVVETDNPFLVEVNWCVCGAFAPSLSGCWEISFYLNNVDGVAASSGQLPNSTRAVPVESVKPVTGTNDDVPKRCYNLQVTIPGNTVQPGAYSLLAIIKLYSGVCPPKPANILGDYLGFGQIPVLVFVPAE
jgi:hypothetical protein